METKHLLLICLIIVLGVTIIILITSKPTYHIYKIDCKLTSLNDTCNEKIEQKNISFSGIFYEKEDLNEFLLNNFCNQLNENSWGCGKYLVLYE